MWYSMTILVFLTEMDWSDIISTCLIWQDRVLSKKYGQNLKSKQNWLRQKNFDVNFLVTFDCFYLKLFSAGIGYVEALPPPPSPPTHCPDFFKM